jgi:hypothetical protein
MPDGELVRREFDGPELAVCTVGFDGGTASLAVFAAVPGALAPPQD